MADRSFGKMHNPDKGESKIERGLREFRMYRVAPAHKLTTVQARRSKPGKEWYNHTLHFTTQKNMALEYAGEKTVLLEQRGMDFLEDLRAFEQSGASVRVLLLSHEDLYAMDASNLRGMSKEDARRFVESRMHFPSEVSLRALRQAAEVVVFMPEDAHVLPLSKGTLKIQGLSDRYDRRGNRDGRESYGPGGFHQAASVAHFRKHPRSAEIRREVGRLEQIGQEIAERLRIVSRDAKDTKEREAALQEHKRLKETEKQIETLRRTIRGSRD